MLTVINEDTTRIKGSGYELHYFCKCDCGNTISVRKSKIVHNNIINCGCNKPLMYNLIGITFGKLIVIERYGSDSRKEILWICLCECGNTRNVLSSCLRDGSITNCGCIKPKVIHATHMLSKTKIYYIWANMKTRCTNSHYYLYKHYGGKGIIVCDKWMLFDNFYTWAMNNGYKEGLSLDRINNNEGYNSLNCRWVTMKEQQNNRTNNKLLKINNKINTMSMMSSAYEIKYSKLQRLSSEYSEFDVESNEGIIHVQCI